MKKLLIFGAAAAVLSMASCGGNGQSNNNGFDSLFSKAKQDTFLINDATLNGYQINRAFEQRKAQDSTLSKDKFMKGVMYAMSADTLPSFQMGMQVGMGMAQYLMNLEKRGMTIDRHKYLAQFGDAFKKESVNDSVVRSLNFTQQILEGELRQAQEAYRKAQIEASEESQTNIKQGREYIDSLRKADPSLVVTASGVAYQIDSIGTGEKLKGSDRVILNIVGTTLDGREFANNSGSDRPVVVDNEVPGLAEALKELNPGSVATIYVPGKEAFGTEGRLRGGVQIGPNQMVVYKVKVVGLYDPAKDKK